MQKLPLWPLRVAFFDRLSTHPAMDLVDLRADGDTADYPFLDLGPVILNDASAGSEYGTECIVQVDAFALVIQAGGKAISDMLDAATQAVSDGELAVDGFGEATYLGFQAGQIVADFDRELSQEVYHGVIQYRFAIFQP